jgi:uncharacterized protein
MNKLPLVWVSLALTAAGMAAAPIAQAVSRVDCDSPTSRAERKVCNDARLLRLHNKLRAETERRASAGNAAATAPEDLERWVARRDACWTKRCIARAYALRLERLENAGPPNAGTPNAGTPGQ